jgi:hypothetical protein
MGVYMCPIAILCYMLRVYSERGVVELGYECNECNESSRRRIGGPAHAMSSPSWTWSPLSPLGSCWTRTGRPPISARLGGLLSPSHLPSAGQTHHCLCRDCLQTRHALCPRRRNTLPSKHVPRLPLDIRSTCARQPPDCLCRVYTRITSHDCPSQPLPSTCAPTPTPTQFIHKSHTA